MGVTGQQACAMGRGGISHAAENACKGPAGVTNWRGWGRACRRAIRTTILEGRGVRPRREDTPMTFRTGSIVSALLFAASITHAGQVPAAESGPIQVNSRIVDGQLEMRDAA